MRGEENNTIEWCGQDHMLCPNCHILMTVREYQSHVCDAKPKSCMEAQQGGNHYQQGSIQPIEYIHSNQLNFFEGNCIKYVTRNRRKGTPVEDLKKAIHYLQLNLKLDHGIDSNIEYTQCNTSE